MLNRIQLIGNLGHDPDIRVMQDGKKVATFSLATHTSWKDEQGEWNKKTEWHSVVVYREIFIDRIEKALKKGHVVFVEGKLGYKEVEDKDTQQKRRVAQIIVSEKGGRVEFLRFENLEDRNVGSADEDVLQDCSEVNNGEFSPIESSSSETPMSHKLEDQGPVAMTLYLSHDE